MEWIFSKFNKFRESGNLPKHELGLISHVCLAGIVVASWSLRQDVAGSIPFTVMTNIFVIKFSEFKENI